VRRLARPHEQVTAKSGSSRSTYVNPWVAPGTIVIQERCRGGPLMLIVVAGPVVAAFMWYLWANVKGLTNLRRTDARVVVPRRTYTAPLPDKPLDTSARALIRELHGATPRA